jgi:hypothetical protein
MKTIKIPARMRHLAIDHRGYPISVTVLVDEAGRPNFTINDEAKRQEIIREDRCPICGDKLLRGRWSVGGQLVNSPSGGEGCGPFPVDAFLKWATPTASTGPPIFRRRRGVRCDQVFATEHFLSGVLVQAVVAY